MTALGANSHVVAVWPEAISLCHTDKDVACLAVFFAARGALTDFPVSACRPIYVAWQYFRAFLCMQKVSTDAGFDVDQISSTNPLIGTMPVVALDAAASVIEGGAVLRYSLGA